jgi:hypothetical protein
LFCDGTDNGRLSVPSLQSTGSPKRYSAVERARLITKKQKGLANSLFYWRLLLKGCLNKMSAKQIITILTIVFGIAGVFFVSIGGFSFNPQTVTVSSGAIRPIANGRAQILIDEVGTSVGVTIWCKKDRQSLELDFDGKPSESVCGIQVSVVEVLEGRMGLPEVKIKVSW